MSRTAIVGFGCAGYHAAKALRHCDAAAEIHVFTETPEAPYNPMLTTYYVAGKIDRDTMMPYGRLEDIARELKLVVHNDRVKKLRARERILELSTGEEMTFDDVVLATGSHPLVPPIAGLPADRKGVYVMRTVADADRLLADIQKGIRSAVVIGASWVGIKVVEALHAHHVPTTLTDMAPRIFPTATLPEVADIIHRRLADMGVGLKFGSGIASVERDGEEMVCTFADGTSIRSDMVALCLGLRPTVDIVDPAEFDMGKGLRVDLGMRTSVPHVYAVGDCCEAYEMITRMPMNVNLWANAHIQGQVAGRNIAGVPSSFQGNFIHNITHFMGLDFIGLGDNRTQGEHIQFVHPKEGWIFHAIANEKGIGCINILDNHAVSGPAKAALIKSLTAPEELGPTAWLALRKSGLPASIIDQIGGHHDD